VPTSAHGRASRRLARAACAVAIAAAQFRLLVLLLGPRYRLSVEAAEGVLRGEPHWRVYQNRLLGPWLVEILEPAAGSFERAHALVSIALLAVAGYVLLAFLERVHRDPARAHAAWLAGSFLVVCCFGRDWLYVWDLVDLLVFVVWNALVVTGARWPAHAALVAVAIWNRETALFVAAWMAVDPPLRWLAARRDVPRPRLDVPRMAAGLALVAGGVALVETLRSTLLVRETGPDLVGAVAGAGPSVHVMLAQNASALAAAFSSFRFTLSFLVPVALVLFLVLCVRVARRDPTRNAGLALIHASIVASLVVFGILFETRIYLPLVPFVAFHLWPAAGLEGGLPR
jgi:hypothetical protein